MFNIYTRFETFLTGWTLETFKKLDYFEMLKVFKHFQVLNRFENYYFLAWLYHIFLRFPRLLLEELTGWPPTQIFRLENYKFLPLRKSELLIAKSSHMYVCMYIVILILKDRFFNFRNNITTSRNEKPIRWNRFTRKL